MRKITYLLLFVFCFNFAQTEDAYQSILSKVSEAYNTKNADNLFNLFSPEFQSEFSKEKVQEFISKNQDSKGNIGEFSFLTDEESTKKYLVEFDEASTIMIIGLTPDNKISEFALEEY